MIQEEKKMTGWVVWQQPYLFFQFFDVSIRCILINEWTSIDYYLWEIW